MKNDKAKFDFTSLRSVLESKTKDVLVQCLECVGLLEVPKNARKADLVELLMEKIPANPGWIGRSFPPIDHEFGDAMWNAFQWGSARIAYPRANYQTLARQAFFLGADISEKELIIYVPNEIREMYRNDKVREEWERQRGTWDYFDDVAEACVRRYGHVTANEILALVVKWGGWEKNLETKKAIKLMLGGRSLMCVGSGQYYLFGDAVLHVSICGNDIRECAEIVPDFLKSRDRFPRWTTESEKEFLSILNCDFYEDTPAANRLREFLELECKVVDLEVDDDEAGDDEAEDSLVGELLGELRKVIEGGDHLDTCVDIVKDYSTDWSLDIERRLLPLLQDFADHTRLRWFNGHTPAEVGRKYVPLADHLVCFADETDETQLRFPNLTLEEAHEDAFDRLDDEEPPPDNRTDWEEWGADTGRHESGAFTGRHESGAFTGRHESGTSTSREWCGCNAMNPSPEYGFEPEVRSEPKVGRNDPCPCGSGKKYKKCCGR